MIVIIVTFHLAELPEAVMFMLQVYRTNLDEKYSFKEKIEKKSCNVSL